MDWMTLKSGSDIRGIAVGENAVLTPQVARRIGAAFAQWIALNTQKSVRDVVVSLGRDSRITGESLLEATAQGLLLAGAQALDFGLCTTPAMYMSTITEGFRADGAIMITASHHPYQLNGIKCFTRAGGLTGDEIATLIKRAKALEMDTLQGGGTLEKRSFLPVYTGLLENRIRTGLCCAQENPLPGLRIVVDAGNGAGGFFADLLSRLGVQTRGSQFLEPDGLFPNHVPNPENDEAMASVCRAVKDVGADLGVIFDADCDRVAVVDHLGHEINRNRLIALAAAILLRNQKKQTIVTDSVTSTGLSSFIQSLGGVHHRYMRGYRNVIDEAVRLEAAGIPVPLAIETSGHAALHENHYLDDGMYLATLLVMEAMQCKKEGRTLGSLICDLQEPVESTEIRIMVTAPDDRVIGERVIREVLEHAEQNDYWHIAPDNYEGIRISFDYKNHKDSVWFLLRLSVHDPVMPLNVESDLIDGVRWTLEELLPILEKIRGIDCEPVRAYLSGH